MYFITLPFLVLKIFAFYINDMLLFKCPFPGPKGLSQSTSDVILCTCNAKVRSQFDCTEDRRFVGVAVGAGLAAERRHATTWPRFELLL